MMRPLLTRRSVLAGLAGSIVAARSASAIDAPRPNDVARYLAGLTPDAAAPEARWAQDPAWRQHAAAFDQAWNRLEKSQLARVRSWSAKHITARRPTLLYMFSGPDFLYADAFFPDAKTYVMSGLEPVGPLPRITENNRRGLGGLRTSLNTVLNVSFFRTIDMRRQLSSNTFAGTLPLLMIFLARAGKTVVGMRHIGLDAKGQLVEIEPNVRSSATSPANGVEIIFSDASGENRKLYYIQTDVSNRGPGLDALMEFCRSLGPADGFVKSASYLMHAPNFSKIREFLLAQTELLLEDDSGIPMQYFPATDWELKPYGRYLGPIGLFPGRGQRQLAELYARSPREPIDFGIGYRHRQNDSNLLLAVKKPRA